MKVMTSGRYMVANVKEAESRGFRASMGYFDNWTEAAIFAHTHGSPRNPVAVYDSEKVERDFYDIRSIEVYRTHNA